MLKQIANSSPATHVLRPERKDRRLGPLDKISRNITGEFLRLLRARDNWIPDFISRVEHYGQTLEAMKDEELKKVANHLRNYLHLKGFQEEHVAHSFALVREVASRTVGMRHFDTQLIGGWVLLRGMVAEMETGEGKTLTATLAAARRLPFILDLPRDTAMGEMIRVVKERFKERIKPMLVSTGPVKENILKGKEINLYDFPVPMWHLKMEEDSFIHQL